MFADGTMPTAQALATGKSIILSFDPPRHDLPRIAEGSYVHLNLRHAAAGKI